MNKIDKLRKLFGEKELLEREIAFLQEFVRHLDTEDNDLRLSILDPSLAQPVVMSKVYTRRDEITPLIVGSLENEITRLQRQNNEMDKLILNPGNIEE